MQIKKQAHDDSWFFPYQEHVAGLQPASSSYSSVDDNHGKDEVTGSNPVRGSIFVDSIGILSAFSGNDEAYGAKAPSRLHFCVIIGLWKYF